MRATRRSRTASFHSLPPFAAEDEAQAVAGHVDVVLAERGQAVSWFSAGVGREVADAESGVRIGSDEPPEVRGTFSAGASVRLAHVGVDTARVDRQELGGGDEGAELRRSTRGTFRNSGW